MRLVPAGSFTMGSDNGNFDEKPAHQVTLPAFYMDKYEVTNASVVSL
jgi:formylglycine-generating enzyme required for sulfatase activity